MSESNGKRYRLVLMKGGKYQAAVRMNEDGLHRSGLGQMDLDRILRLNVDGTYTDSDGDKWVRLA